MTVADPKWFTFKGKPVIYTKVFVEFYNQKNGRQVHEIHEMIELEKMHVLTTENFRNLSAYRIIDILLILCSAYIVPRGQDKIVFYVNNYIDQDQFNQLYDSDQMKKGI